MLSKYLKISLNNTLRNIYMPEINLKKTKNYYQQIVRKNANN